jgi:hypothetical protein
MLFRGSAKYAPSAATQQALNLPVQQLRCLLQQLVGRCLPSAEAALSAIWLILEWVLRQSSSSSATLQLCVKLVHVTTWDVCRTTEAATGPAGQPQLLADRVPSSVQYRQAKRPKLAAAAERPLQEAFHMVDIEQVDYATAAAGRESRFVSCLYLVCDRMPGNCSCTTLAFNANH